jgi:hypothetical protein
MKLQLIHTENYLLVTFKDRYDEKKYQLFKSTYGDFWINEPNSGKFRTGGHYYNITHHLPLNNAPVLEGIELLPPLEDEVELAYQKELLTDNQDKNWVGYGKGINGVSKERWKIIYNKAKEVYKFTEEDICEFVEWMNLHYRALEHTISFKGVKGTKELINLWKEQQPKLPTEFDTETKQYIYEV